MALYRFDGTIEVHGVDSPQGAINALQIALDDYEDMNPGCATIVIYHNMPKFVRDETD